LGSRSHSCIERTELMTKWEHLAGLESEKFKITKERRLRSRFQIALGREFLSTYELEKSTIQKALAETEQDTAKLEERNG
jgi:hypothetical protein